MSVRRKQYFNLKKGEIHALVGENGAGKSTLMKILFGMEPPSSGEIILRGEPVRFSSSKDAIAHGIGMVHQHFMLVESFTAAQNIILGMEPKKGLFVSEEEAIRFTKEISKKYNLDVDAEAVTQTLPVGVKQKIEILKALARGAEILILDEPTAVLAPQETDQLFDELINLKLPVGVKQKIEILKALARGAEILILDEPTAVLAPQETDQLFDELINLKKQGHTIVFISHKIPEIKRISDRITVMRASQFVGCCETKDVTEQEISAMIMGCEMDTSIQKTVPKPGDVKIQVKNLSYTDKNQVKLLNNINFGVRGGMIFGIAGVQGNGQVELVAGVQGNGQVELVELMTKKRMIKDGDILLNGTSVKDLSIEQIRRMQFGYVPEDRMEQGIAGQESIAENMVSNRYSSKEFCRGGLLNYKKILKFAEERIKSYEIRCSGTGQNVGMLSGGNMQKVVVARECSHNPEVLIAEQPEERIKSYEIRCSGTGQNVGMLSGGNMQKVVVARECSHNPEVLIAEQPTRGVDIGAAHIIHKKMMELRDQGCAVLLISADLSEALKLSDVIAVMYEGEIVAYFDNTEGLNEEKLGLYMLGLEKHSEEQIRRAEG